MDIKENIAGLYIKRFVIPKAQVLDKPGFLVFKISGKTNVYARQMLVPEDLFVKLEKKIVEKYGDGGRSSLYSAGKKFGYSFAQLGRFENIKDHPGEGIKDWIIIAGKFIEGTYASEMHPTTEVQKELVDSVLKNFVICRKLGYDFFFATGGAAGVIAWLFQDKEIEGYYYDNNSSEEEHTCKVLCAPYKTINKIKDTEVFRETNLDNLKQDISSYTKFNSISQVRYSKSFSDFLDAKIFSYDMGIINLNKNNERFFLMEASGMYLLETELRNKKMDNEIFDAAFEVGKGIFGNISSDLKSSSETMTALGWGETTILKDKDKVKVIINHFPWTSWYNQIEFFIVRGILSGICSNVCKRVVKLQKPELDISNKYLALVFNEEL